MERRKVLVIAAALVAALGAVLVFLYVRGADSRAERQFQTTQVLVATAQIEAGETIEAASSAGKIALRPVTNNSLLPDVQTDTAALSGMVATVPIYPGEQIIGSKFGASAAPMSALQIPDGKIAISVNLTDPARVAGFVNPGSDVSIFLNGTDPKTGKAFTQLLLSKVTVIGVGSTTPVPTTTTDQSGAQTTEQLPRTLLTLAVTQDEAQKILFSQGNGELVLGLLNTGSVVRPGTATTYDNLFG